MENLEPVSIVIPVLREADNIPTLVQRISKINLANRPFEVILMDDDSQDGSIEIVQQLRPHYPWIKLIVRQGPRGLSRAVIDGFKLAQYPLLLVMDGDLSHHPERIPDLLSQLTEPNVDMVIGSRYVTGGGIDADWPLRRKIISHTSAMMARMFLQLPIKDPLSGFIGIRKNLFESAKNINPIGWKIGLEMMVRCKCKNIIEVPICFSDRHAGRSKLTLKVGFNYLMQLFQLLLYKTGLSSHEK